MGVRWQDVRVALEAEIAEGHLRPGDKVPTEPELCRRFGAGRHSVRRAIASLAVDGKLRAEQGRGTFVEDAELINYTIGKRTRRSENFGRRGINPGGHLIESATISADARIAEALQIEMGAEVAMATRISEADGVPIAYGTAYRPADRFPDFAERQGALGSVTATYHSYGIADYLRGSTTFHARRARAHEAAHLRQHPDQPVLVVRAVDVDMDRRPISFSQVVWSATRVSFTLDTLGEMPDD